MPRRISIVFSKLVLSSSIVLHIFLQSGNSNVSQRNYTQVLVLLLRLRQICSHPSLVQEGGAAFIFNDPADDESGTDQELMRACKLVSSEFVARMKTKLKASALQRMEAEKQVQLIFDIELSMHLKQFPVGRCHSRRRGMPNLFRRFYGRRRHPLRPRLLS